MTDCCHNYASQDFTYCRYKTVYIGLRATGLIGERKTIISYQEIIYCLARVPDNPKLINISK